MTQPPSSPYGSGEGDSDPQRWQPPFGDAQPSGEQPPYGQPPQPGQPAYGQPPPPAGSSAYGQPPPPAGSSAYGQQQPYCGDPYGQRPPPLYGGQQSGQPYAGQPPTKRSVLPWVLGGCGVLLLLAVGFIVVIVLLVRAGGVDDLGGPVRPSSGDSEFDSRLDRLWDECDGGSDDACDDLYDESPLGSDYETFGSTCGGRSEEMSGDCAGG